MMKNTLAIKIDVDTDRGTRIGVPNLLALFSELNIPATFLFSLGPDNTGRAIKRIFRPGFLKKVSRSSVLSMYGIRTLLNGTLLPGPHIGKRNQESMYQVFSEGHEVGIHCYDHIRWQDGLAKMSEKEVYAEFAKADQEFERIFAFKARTAGAAGWQANDLSLAAYDEAKLLYASDARGRGPFYPRVKQQTFKTLQVPTNLPTLDELLGRPEYPLDKMTDFYLSQLQEECINVFTAHAEVEGMKYLSWFKTFIKAALAKQFKFVKVEEVAKKALEHAHLIPTCDLIQGFVHGRSGTLAVQK